MKKYIKILLAFLHDFFTVNFSWLLAYSLRFNFTIPDEQIKPMLLALPAILLISMLTFYFVGLYRGIWRFASIVDLKRIIVSVLFPSCSSFSVVAFVVFVFS
jgi:FlaA1/EpsC-like NDP-sugar epimerase